MREFRSMATSPTGNQFAEKYSIFACLQDKFESYRYEQIQDRIL